MRQDVATRSLRRTGVWGVAALLSGAIALSGMGQAQAMAKPKPEMKAVLDQLKALGAKPINTLTVKQARMNPTPAEAVKTVLKKRRQSFPEPVGSVTDRVLNTPSGPRRVRIYTPATGNGPFPVTMYFHGGGFVIAQVSTYDSSCRAIANAAKTMVVAVAYPLAPEKKVPAAHEYCYAATQYVMKNAASMNGDPNRVAVFGESAGGNLATDMCIMARDRGGKMPLYQVLIYPYVDMTPEGLNAPSMIENKNAAPLNRATVAWFNRYALPSQRFSRKPLVSPLKYANVKGLPPATVVLAELDPLRSQGAAYAAKLSKAGVRVRTRLFPGVTHEFFGMGAVVPDAQQAVAFAAEGLNLAFNR